jgi:hypothetical protein
MLGLADALPNLPFLVLGFIIVLGTFMKLSNDAKSNLEWCGSR